MCRFTDLFPVPPCVVFSVVVDTIVTTDSINRTGVKNLSTPRGLPFGGYLPPSPSSSPMGKTGRAKKPEYIKNEHKKSEDTVPPNNSIIRRRNRRQAKGNF